MLSSALFRSVPRRIRWIAGILGLGLIAWGVLRGRSSSKSEDLGDGSSPVMATAVVKPFVLEVIEKGEVQSSANVEVRCQVAAKNSTGTTILQLVDEGTVVKEGDVLARLDDSALKADLVAQQITHNTSKAAVVEAEATLEAARLSLKEYESGTFRQEEQTIESEEFVAREDLRRAEEYLRYSQKLAARGYVTEVQLEADKFALEKAKKTLSTAQTKLRVLREFTRQKMINQLEAAVETAETKLASAKSTEALDAQKVTLMETQIKLCVINAPAAGQVVYAIDSNRSSDNPEPSIAEGKQVRDRQVMFRLPDPTRMQVLARINESNVEKVKLGMIAKVTADALPGVVLTARVASVSEYPLSRDWWNSLKEYAAEVEIESPPANLRPGMSAQVSIEVQRIPEALQVPVQAVLAEGRQHFLFVPTGGDPSDVPLVREVQLGPANETTVVIKSGLQAAEAVLLAPQNYVDRVSLPVRPVPPAAEEDKGRRKGPAEGSPGPNPAKGQVPNTAKTSSSGAPPKPGVMVNSTPAVKGS